MGTLPCALPPIDFHTAGFSSCVFGESGEIEAGLVPLIVSQYAGGSLTGGDFFLGIITVSVTRLLFLRFFQELGACSKLDW